MAYLRYELLRTLRGKRFLLFTTGVPLALFYLLASGHRHEHLDAVPTPTYFMAGMAAWGAMIAVTSSGIRIAAERATGWQRQIRTTPLTSFAYVRAKVLSGYATAFLALGCLLLAGATVGAHLTVAGYTRVLLFFAVGLLPFAALGILLGHLLSVDAMGPATGGVGALFAILGGAWGPIGTGTVLKLSQLLPSYWLVRASHPTHDAAPWSAKGWLVVAVWTAATTYGAAVAFRHRAR